MLYDDDIDIIVHHKDQQRVDDAIQKHTKSMHMKVNNTTFGYAFACTELDDVDGIKDFIVDVFFFKNSSIWKRPFTETSTAPWNDWEWTNVVGDDELFEGIIKIDYWGLSNIPIPSPNVMHIWLKKAYGISYATTAKIYNHTIRFEGEFDTSMFPMLRVPHPIPYMDINKADNLSKMYTKCCQ